jgi:FdhE protein
MMEASISKRIPGKLFRQRAAIAPEVAAALEQLDRLAEASPVLREAAALQGAVLRAAYADPPRATAPDIAPERAADKLRDGVPLLRGERLDLDLPAIEALMLRVCKAIRAHAQTPGPAGEIATAIERRALPAGALVDAALGGQVAAIHERAAKLGVDGGLLGTIVRWSLFPALVPVAAQLAPLRTVAWEPGYCPICGSWPLQGEHRGLEQTRFLRCGLCAAEWPVDRLLCPYCASRDHQDLGYLHVEGAEQQRAVTCESCHGYLKVVASLTPIPPPELAVRDIATLHLDMVALERGYAAPI